MRLARLLCVISIVLNVLGCWIMWEAVVRPLKMMAPGVWNRGFPSPFYVFEAPIWFWHDLAILLIIVGTMMLAYYALKT